MGPVAPEYLRDGIKALHYAYPALALFYFIAAQIVTVCTLQTRKLRAKDQHVRRRVILSLIGLVTATYLTEAITVVVRIFRTDLTLGQDKVVYLLCSTIFFTAEALTLTDSEFPVWYPFYGTWFIGLTAELTLLVVPNVLAPPRESYDLVVTIVQSARVVLFVILPSTYFGLRNDNKEYDNADAERQSLLRKKLASKPGSSEDSATNLNGYGGTETNQDSETTTANNSDGDDDEDYWAKRDRKAQELIDKRLQQDGNWFTYAKGFSIFFPYLWPFHSKTLQFRALLVGFCLLITNALNVLVPNQMGVMVDSLSHHVVDGQDNNIWLPVLLYAIYRFAAGGAGIGWIRRWLWIPLEQYSYDSLSTASHSHLMNLSSDFHDGKTSSELSQAVHGGRSVTSLLETVIFQVLPMFVDLAVAFAYLWLKFGPYMGLIMAATVVVYLYVTTKLHSQKASKRREYVAIYRKEWTIGQQSLDGWMTASLFNMIPYERKRYASAVSDHMRSKKSYEMSSQVITAGQALVMAFGILGAMFLGVYQVAYEGKSLGQFTTLLTYWAQLQAPLVFFSTMYREISYSLMDAERLLELFQTKPTITDLPSAKSLILSKGLVKFDRVSFAYDERKPTLKNVTFVVPAGKTIALVGETGGGKSTILKLIHRFYDVKSGSISIDNQDIRDVTLTSLREHIGVVPQDPTLFNDSIMNNIRYARLSATDKDVYEACRAAAIHDKIMSFPDGYNSKVGDRGVKLSGGEKQRVAIARAILKQPQIILLDEATSAVDTDTESLIQEGLRSLCTDKTTFIVAHRLSTIMRADHILVVMNGEIIEQGSHDDLIYSKGKYHDLWSKQIFVRPATNRSRSRSKSPVKKDANIINDLTPIRQKVELAKVMKTVVEAGCSEDDDAIIENGKKLEGTHLREGSRLKPDAPVFVPSSPSKSAPPTETVSKPRLNQAATPSSKERKCQEKEERKIGSLSKKAGRKAAADYNTKDLGGNLDEAEKSSIGGSAASSDQVTDGDVSNAEKTKSKRIRLPNKRQLTKSEPANRACESLDGQQDSDIPTTSLGEAQPITQALAQRRRVSAPSDPPASQETRNARSRGRNRHWRLRNRAAEKTGSATASSLETTSGDMSTDHHIAPPVPSPAAGVLVPKKESVISKVTFATS